jgi:hypothetical protein
VPYTTLDVLPAQDSWRWCSKCSGLFYGGGKAPHGMCPVDHNVQTVSGSVVVDPRTGKSHSVSGPDSGPPPGHQAAGSPYRVAFVRGAPGPWEIRLGVGNDGGQANWRWCNQCQGIFFSNGNQRNGVCPYGDNRGPHNSWGSGPYQMYNTDDFVDAAR